MDPKIDPMLDPVLGEVLEVSWHHLGGILGRFGVSFGRLGPSWGGLGLSLECLWGFGSSWVCFGEFLAASWGVFLGVWQASWAVLGASCVVLGPLLFLEAYGVAVTWFQSGWASGASGRSCDLAQFQKASANASIACS